ncbi:MAG TPA: diguanylate cyclase [Acidobacteriota bacterium]|nr:diguanylate cyclase [Acidobacteriota bacterium]
MNLDVHIPRSWINLGRKLLRPSGPAAFCAVIALTAATCLLSGAQSSTALRVLRILFLVVGIVIAWLGCGRQSRTARPVMQIFLVLVLLIYLVQTWRLVPYLEPAVPDLILVCVAALLYGARDALILVGIIVLLAFVNPSPPGGAEAGFLARIAFEASCFSVAAILIANLTSGQRRRIASLREELHRVRSNPLAADDDTNPERVAAYSRRVSTAEEETETLDPSIRAILVRIRRYFRAHSVLLYQLSGSRSLELRHWVSDVSVDSTSLLDLRSSLIGRIFGRGISCNWNLDDPNCGVTPRDISYYTEWQPVRNLAGTPLKLHDQPVGILVVDRTAPSHFTELEILHMETFALQLVEMIEMGKRYLEQVDRNMEYKLFYQAMSELGQSLATDQILAALAKACQDVVQSTHVLIALLDESGLSYEIGFAEGAEQLKGTRVKSQGRTWASWLLNSDTGPLLLKDVRSHASRMPVASPREGDLSIRSLLMIPLVAKGKKMGVVLLGSTQPDYFLNWHMRILKLICVQAAANIENSLLHRRVENEAFSDGLTQLFNHRYFQDRLKTELSRARRSNTKLSLLMTDIDHFKKVNDSYGHRIGDAILQQMSDILRRTVRSEDVVARYGGEEFVIILVGSNRKGALKMAERLRAAAEKCTFSAEEQKIKASMSIGAATYPDDAGEPWELIECADRALYSAKGQGRNRVVAYDSIQQPVQGRPQPK